MAPLTVRHRLSSGYPVRVTLLPQRHRRAGAQVSSTCGPGGVTTERSRTRLRRLLTRSTQRHSGRSITWRWPTGPVARWVPLVVGRTPGWVSPSAPRQPTIRTWVTGSTSGPAPAMVLTLARTIRLRSPWTGLLPKTLPLFRIPFR